MHIDTPPLHLFITGSGGCGKSHLIKTVYHSLTKTLCSKNSDRPKVMLVAPTGVGAINIEGMTIHSGLGIPIGHHGKHVSRLGDKMRSKLRSKLSELCVVILDEISMVSNLLLLYIYQRLVEVLWVFLRFAICRNIYNIGDFLSATTNSTNDNLCRIQRCVAEYFTFTEAL